jgi:hypothetical protein
VSAINDHSLKVYSAFHTRKAANIIFSIIYGLESTTIKSVAISSNNINNVSLHTAKYSLSNKTYRYKLMQFQYVPKAGGGGLSNVEKC